MSTTVTEPTCMPLAHEEKSEWKTNVKTRTRGKRDAKAYKPKNEPPAVQADGVKQAAIADPGKASSSATQEVAIPSAPTVVRLLPKTDRTPGGFTFKRSWEILCGIVQYQKTATILNIVTNITEYGTPNGFVNDTGFNFLVHSTGDTYNDHPQCNLRRAMVEEIICHNFLEGKTNHPIVQVGGNPHRDAAMGRKYHQMCPNAGDVDINRNSFSLAEKYNMKRCNHLLEECDCHHVVAAYLVVFNYNITPAILREAMIRTSCSNAYWVGHYFKQESGLADGELKYSFVSGNRPLQCETPDRCSVYTDLDPRVWFDPALLRTFGLRAVTVAKSGDTYGLSISVCNVNMLPAPIVPVGGVIAKRHDDVVRTTDVIELPLRVSMNTPWQFLNGIQYTSKQVLCPKHVVDDLIHIYSGTYSQVDYGVISLKTRDALRRYDAQYQTNDVINAIVQHVFIEGPKSRLNTVRMITENNSSAIKFNNTVPHIFREKRRSYKWIFVLILVMLFISRSYAMRPNYDYLKYVENDRERVDQPQPVLFTDWFYPFIANVLGWFSTLWVNIVDRYHDKFYSQYVEINQTCSHEISVPPYDGSIRCTDPVCQIKPALRLVGPYCPYVTYYVPASCTHNEMLSLAVRVFPYHKGNGTSWAIITPASRELMRGIRCAKVGDIETFLAQYPPARRRQLRAAHESLKITPYGEDHHDSYIKAFLKNEITISWDKQIVARMIQSRSDRYFMSLGPWMKGFSKELQRHLKKKNIHYTKGFNPVQLGALASDILLEGYTIAIKGDFGKFDSTQGEECHDLEMEWYRESYSTACAHNNDTASAMECVEDQASNTLYTRNGICARFDYRRKSGDANTSDGNTLINTCVHVSYLKSIGISDFHLMVLGDDVLIFMRPRDSVIYKNAGGTTAHEVFALHAGFVLELYMYTTPQFAEYCSGLFYPVLVGGSERLVWGVLPGKHLMKINSMPAKHFANPTKWLRDVACSYANCFPYVPVLGDYASYLHKMRGAGEDLFGQYLPHNFNSLFNVESYGPTWDFVAHYYGLTVASLKSVTQQLITLSERASPLLDFAFTSMCRHDAKTEID